MILPAPDLEAWIAALRTDITATATALPSSDYSPMQKPAIWRLGVFASAYFYILSQDDVQRLMRVVPQLHKEFQTLTGHALTKYLGFNSGGFAKKPYTQEEIEAQFLRKEDGIGVLSACDAPTKESSSKFSFHSICGFEYAKQNRSVAQWDQNDHKKRILMLSFLSVDFPLALWRSRSFELRSWWLSALQRLQPVQAYMGLGMGLPPILERYPFQQSAEFALARNFLGLDVDKPFFMRSSTADGMSLESGMRTPSFGVLVSGEYLRLLGGADALASKLKAIRNPAGQSALRIDPCLDGFWIEAGDAPALLPVEQGVPPQLQALAQALKPVRLEKLWLISYPPNVPRDDIFSPETSARWLARFDEDSDWPSAEARRAGKPSASSSPPRTPGGYPCPQTGWWHTPAKAGSRRYFRQGAVMPEIAGSAYGATFWLWDHDQSAPRL